MAKHFSWEFDFWRRMGWREFRAWSRAMNEQLRANDPDPYAWSEASRRNFDEIRQRAQGRAA